MQPTPTMSPTRCSCTASPTRDTRPITSWPGMHGYTVLDHSLRTWWMSEWHTPQNITAISTSFGAGSSRSNSMGLRRLKECCAA